MQLKLETHEYIVTKIRRKTINRFRHRHLHKPNEENFASNYTTKRDPQLFRLHRFNLLPGHLATRTLLLDLLASKRHSRFGGRSSTRLVLHSSLDLACHCQESLLDIGRSLRRSLQEFNPKSISKFFTLFRRNNTLSLKITLITH